MAVTTKDKIKALKLELIKLENQLEQEKLITTLDKFDVGQFSYSCQGYNVYLSYNMVGHNMLFYLTCELKTKKIYISRNKYMRSYRLLKYDSLEKLIKKTEKENLDKFFIEAFIEELNKCEQYNQLVMISKLNNILKNNNFCIYKVKGLCEIHGDDNIIKCEYKDLEATVMKLVDLHNIT